MSSCHAHRCTAANSRVQSGQCRSRRSSGPPNDRCSHHRKCHLQRCPSCCQHHVDSTCRAACSPCRRSRSCSRRTPMWCCCSVGWSRRRRRGQTTLPYTCCRFGPSSGGPGAAGAVGRWAVAWLDARRAARRLESALAGGTAWGCAVDWHDAIHFAVQRLCGALAVGLAATLWCNRAIRITRAAGEIVCREQAVQVWKSLSAFGSVVKRRPIKIVRLHVARALCGFREALGSSTLRNPNPLQHQSTMPVGSAGSRSNTMSHDPSFESLFVTAVRCGSTP